MRVAFLVAQLLREDIQRNRGDRSSNWVLHCHYFHQGKVHAPGVCDSGVGCRECCRPGVARVCTRSSKAILASLSVFWYRKTANSYGTVCMFRQTCMG